MLHLIFQSAIDKAVLQRIDNEDDVVFFENALFSVCQGGVLTDILGSMLKNNVHFFTIQDQLTVRGIVKSELVSGIQVIDYSGLVKLTEKNKTISTWT